MQPAAAQLQKLLDGPALAPPKDVATHHYAGNEELLTIVTTLCMTIAGLLILLRIYTQLSVNGRFDVADYFIFSAYTIAVSVVVISRIAMSHGWGARQWTLQLKQLFNVLYYINIEEALYGPMIFCVKMSITFQYLRMFAPNRTVNPFVYYGSWLIVIICTLFYTITTLLTIFACAPREKIWNKLYVGGHCLTYRAIILSTAIFNIISDVAILLLPVRTVWKLRIPTQKKVAISLLFGTGLLACIASGMRAYYTMGILKGGLTADISYDSVLTGVWSIAEIALGLIVACTFSLPKLIKVKGGGVRGFFSSFAKTFTTRTRTTKLDTSSKSSDSMPGTVVRMTSLDSHV